MKRRVYFLISILFCISLLGIFIAGCEDKPTPSEHEPYTPEQYTLTFDTLGGDALEPIRAERSQEIALPTPTRAGYRFLGWYTSVTPQSSLEAVTYSEMPGKDVTLYAGWASDSYVGDLVYSYDADAQGYIVSDYMDGEHITVPSEVFGLPVVAIGEEAFVQAEGMHTVDMRSAQSLVRIEAGAFRFCYGLYEVMLPDTLEYIGASAFAFTSNLFQITIPQSVTEVGSAVFESSRFATLYCMQESKPSGWAADWNAGRPVVWDCTRNIIADDGAVYSVQDGVLYCYRSGAVQVLSTNAAVGDTIRIAREITVDGKSCAVTDIAATAFSDAHARAIYIPDTITRVGEYAINFCQDAVIYCEATAPGIGWSVKWNSENRPVIWDCANNTYDEDGYLYVWYDSILYALQDGQAFVAPQEVSGEVVIPSEITYGAHTYPVVGIMDDAFRSNIELRKIVLPASIRQIGLRIFYNCSSLLSVEVAQGNPTYYSVGNCIVETATQTIVAGCSESVMPTDGSIRHIGQEAFYGCSLRKEELVIPQGVESIGERAFLWSSFRRVQLPDSLLKIGEQAFCNNYGLQKITIPQSVTEIGARAFLNCESMQQVVLPRSIVTIGASAFAGCKVLTIYCQATTQPSGWNVDWNIDGCTVVWDCDENQTAPDGATYVMIDGLRYALQGDIAHVAKSVAKGDLTIPSCVVYQGKEYTVTGIQAGAFLDNRDLKRVTIPDSVTWIGEQAFAECMTLQHVTLPAALEQIADYTFENCSRLTEIVVPASVAQIGECAFIGCLDLQRVELQEGIASIGSWAFSDCKTLQTITIPLSVIQMGDSVFLGNEVLTIYCVATEMPSEWQQGWDGFGSTVVWDCNRNAVAEDGYIYTYVDGVRYGIRDGEAQVARSAVQADQVVIPSSIDYQGVQYPVTRIVDEAFAYADRLQTVFIPASVTQIGWGIFSHCSVLRQIEVACDNPVYHSDGNCIIETATRTLVAGCVSSMIPTDGSVTKIGKSAFNGLMIKGITIPDTVTEIGEYAFAYSNLTHISLPSGITRIGNSAFRRCDWLLHVELPDTLIEIGDDAFSDCTALLQITLPSSLTRIGNRAFAFCNKLTTITIPSQVDSMGAEVFGGCPQLTIRCVAPSQPEGWAENWNYGNNPVEWGYKQA